MRRHYNHQKINYKSQKFKIDHLKKGRGNVKNRRNITRKQICELEIKEGRFMVTYLGNT